MRGPGPALSSALLDRLYAGSGAAKWALSREAFGEAIGRSVAHAFEDRRPTAAEIEHYAAALHLDDLALAVACAAGLDPAWEFFVAAHRPLLQRAADAIDSTGGARELADSLYADLYGMGERDGARQSLFRYFHGRSKLSTWLRAVLAQRHIDRLRAGRKLDPLPDDQDTLPARGNGDADRMQHPERDRFESAMQAALAGSIAALPPRDRLRLSCYYVQDLTLAAIGRMLKEHEATVSRHLTRTRAAIRDAVWARLRNDHGMDDGAIVECFRAVSLDAGAMDLASLIGNPAERKKSQPDRSRE
jgi:RNA polymerase sigma-70 factor (ECF subfamily)